MSDTDTSNDKLTVSFWTVAPRPGLITKATILRKSFAYGLLCRNPPWTLSFTVVAPKDEDGRTQLDSLCDVLLTHCYVGSTAVIVGFPTREDVRYLRFGNVYVEGMSTIVSDGVYWTLKCYLRFYEEPTHIENVSAPCY